MTTSMQTKAAKVNASQPMLYTDKTHDLTYLFCPFELGEVGPDGWLMEDLPLK